LRRTGRIGKQTCAARFVAARSFHIPRVANLAIHPETNRDKLTPETVAVQNRVAGIGQRIQALFFSADFKRNPVTRDGDM
jgi:hypothetical protein